MRPPARLLLAVAAGGAVGAVLRHGLGLAAPTDGGVPWTTLAINVSGSFAIALLPTLARVRTSATWTAALGPGLLGGFTTLSTYAEETRALLDDGRAATAAAYAFGTVGLCCAAVLLARSVTGATGATGGEDR